MFCALTEPQASAGSSPAVISRPRAQTVVAPEIPVLSASTLQLEPNSPVSVLGLGKGLPAVLSYWNEF